jgi:hypothetical protein
MLIRVPQRTEDDCTIAVLATVMGLPYTYERVLADGLRYPRFNSDGSFSAWYETYLRDSGFPNEYRSLRHLAQAVSSGNEVGILMLFPNFAGQQAHVVAIDECGFINPSTGWPDRIGSLQELIQEYRRLGYEYTPDKDFLAVDIAQQRRAPRASTAWDSASRQSSPFRR